MEELPEPKRPRCQEDETTPVAWTVCFAHSSTLRMFFENIGNLVQECSIDVICNEDFKGFSIETLDTSRVCLVQARISGHVTVFNPKEQHSFCVRMTNLNLCLKSARPSDFVDFWNPINSTDVVVQIHEPHVSSYVPVFTMRTLAILNQSDEILKPMQYDFYVELDLETFKNQLKTAKSLRADNIKIDVHGLRSRDSSCTDPVTTFFVISYDGDEVNSKCMFQSSTEPPKNDAEPLVIRASVPVSDEYTGMPPMSQLLNIYSGVFGIEILSLATKGMERHALTMRLGVEKPLLLEFPLGSGSVDYIRCVVAPKALT